MDTMQMKKLEDLGDTVMILKRKVIGHNRKNTQPGRDPCTVCTVTFLL